MSPIYCQDIIDSVSNQLNRLYLKFLKRNPGYDGKVSIYGHSLGSVLSYDILCHQENLSSPFPMDSVYTDPSRNGEVAQNISYESFGSNFNNDGTRTTPIDLHDDDDKQSGYPTPVFLQSTDGKCAPAIPSTGPDIVSVGNDALLKATNVNGKTETSSLQSSGVNNAGDVSEKILEEIYDPTSDEDEKIKGLKAEVDFLRMRLAELESLIGDVDSHVHHVTYAAIPCEDPAKFPPGEGDPMETYKPYIHYTKLEFKVDTFFAVGSPIGVFLALRNGYRARQVDHSILIPSQSAVNALPCAIMRRHASSLLNLTHCHTTVLRRA
ncbi:hypothetical protein Dimus_003393 [Dionaea muscipula]